MRLPHVEEIVVTIPGVPFMVIYTYVDSPGKRIMR